MVRPVSARYSALFVIPFLLTVPGCKKPEAAPPVQTASPSQTAAPAPAAPAPTPAAAVPSGPTETAPSGAANGVMISATSGTGVDWALKQDEVKNDPHGQWAIAATASSSYGDATGTDRYAPSQATGAPNVDQESDNPAAWTSKTADAGIEWLDLTFAKPAFANGLRIRENEGAGAIVKVDLYDDQGKVHPLWSGTDPTKELNYFILTFPKTAFKTNRAKITLATNVVPGWNEIDAVQLLSDDK